MKYKLYLITIGFIIFTKAFGQITNDKLQSIDQILKIYDGDRPGCIVSIIYHQDEVYEKGFGKTNLKDKVDLTPKTPFYIASMTKQFIGAGIGILAIQDKLNLDDSIYKYLPELSQYEKKITIKHLLNHTSGIRDYSNLMFMRGDTSDGFISLSEVIRLLSNQSNLNFEPGEKHLYSNSNYVLLAEIISRASESDYRSFIRQNIFLPLKMKNTYFVPPNSNLSNGAARAYFINKKGEYEPLIDLVPVSQDQIITTIQDFQLWIRNLRSKKVGGDELFRTITSQDSLSNGQSVNYSFGLRQEIYRGQSTFSHGGYLRGFESNYVYLPEDDISIVVFDISSDINAYNLTYNIVDIIKEGELSPPKSIALPTTLPSINLSNKDLVKYCGFYWYNEYQSTREIYINNDTLRYKNPGSYERVLLPVGENQFRRLDASKSKQTAHITFDFDDKGKRMIIDSNISDSLVMEEFIVPKYSKSLFKEIEGHYYCKDLDVKYQLKKMKGLIRVILNDEVQSRLVVQRKDLYKDYHFGSYRFVRNKQSKIIGFYLSIERSKNLYFEKISK